MDAAHVSALQLDAILDGIPARVALVDRDRRHRYVNHEYARFIGQPPHALLGRTVAEVIGAAAFEAVFEHGQRALGGETVQWDGWLPYAEGTDQRFVQRFYIPHWGETGTVDGYLVFARDLTDLKQTERRLAEQVAALQVSQALNAAITASALDCMVAIDETGCVVEFNPAAERTFGHARADVLGRAIGDVIVPPHLRARHAAGFARISRPARRMCSAGASRSRGCGPTARCSRWSWPSRRCACPDSGCSRHTCAT